MKVKNILTRCGHGDSPAAKATADKRLRGTPRNSDSAHAALGGPLRLPNHRIWGSNSAVVRLDRPRRFPFISGAAWSLAVVPVVTNAAQAQCLAVPTHPSILPLSGRLLRSVPQQWPPADWLLSAVSPQNACQRSPKTQTAWCGRDGQISNNSAWLNAPATPRSAYGAFPLIAHMDQMSRRAFRPRRALVCLPKNGAPKTKNPLARPGH